MRIVIVSDELGIYLGSMWGLGFWSILDPAGQPSACTFASEADAVDFMSTWDEPVPGCRFVPVATRHGTSATIADLKAAGLADLLGNMEHEALLYAEPAGNA